MLNQKQHASIKEYDLPSQPGDFTLTMGCEREVIAIVPSGGKYVLSVQEPVGDQTRDFSFTLVAAGVAVELKRPFAAYGGKTECLGCCEVAGTRLYLFGLRQGISVGGAC